MSSTFEIPVEEQIRRRGERLLGLFFRAWAHELNNPVQAVLAGAELIELELGVPDASLAEIRDRVSFQSREVATEVVRVSEGIARLHGLCRPPIGLEGRSEMGDLLTEANALWTPVSRHAGLQTRFPDPEDLAPSPTIALTREVAVLVLVDALTAIWQGGEEVGDIDLRVVAEGAAPGLELVFAGGSLSEAKLAEQRPLWDALGVDSTLGEGSLALSFPVRD